MPARFGRQTPSRAVAHPPTTRNRAGALTPVVRFREPLRSTDTQGIGRSPGQRLPKKMVGFALVKGFGKMMGLLHPDPRLTVAIEHSGWSNPRFPEHRNRHSRPARNRILEPVIAPTLTETVAARLRKRPGS